MVESILRSCGYTTGLFTSPHLVDVRERIRLNGYEQLRQTPWPQHAGCLITLVLEPCGVLQGANIEGEVCHIFFTLPQQTPGNLRWPDWHGGVLQIPDTSW